MICDSCIHKEVCYEMEEDRQALKHCSDYFNFEEELEKLKQKIEKLPVLENAEITHGLLDDVIALNSVLEIIDKHIAELKGGNNG